MNTSKLLTHEQAKAIYNAMVCLNNIGAQASVIVQEDNSDRVIIVNEFKHGEIAVWDANGELTFDLESTRETYLNQYEFAEAYGVSK